jgi:hypothetical protein
MKSYKIDDHVLIGSIEELLYTCIGRNSTSLDFGHERFLINEMGKYCGREAIITSKTLSGLKYRINLDSGDWHWTSEMFDCDPFWKRIR